MDFRVNDKGGRSDRNTTALEKNITIRGKQLLVIGEHMYLLNKVVKSYPDQDMDNSSGVPPMCVETSYWTCRHRNCHAKAITCRNNDNEEVKAVNKGPSHTCNTSPVDIIHYKARQDIIRIYSEGKDSLSEVYNRIVGDMQIHHPAAVDGFHTIANINSAASRARRKRKRSEANNNYDKVEDHIQLALAAHNEHVVAISNEPHQNQDQMEFVNINQRSPSYAVGLPQEPSLDSLNTLNQAEAQIQNQNHGQSQLDALNVVPSANGGTYLNTPLLGGVYDNRTGDCDMENYVHTETI